MDDFVKHRTNLCKKDRRAFLHNLIEMCGGTDGREDD